MDAFRRSENVETQVVDGKAFLLESGTTEMIVLNRVGTRVWDAVNGERSVEAIVELLAPQFSDVSPAQLDTDVRTFLAELHKLKLVS